MAATVPAHQCAVALSETLRYTWCHHPEPQRIVEDVTRWLTTIDIIIQHEGGVVPDALIQHAGCSKTKRKGTGPPAPRTGRRRT